MQSYGMPFNRFKNAHFPQWFTMETGVKNERKYDEIGVLLPISQFEKKILHHLTEIDGIVLAGREALMRKAGKDSLEL